CFQLSLIQFNLVINATRSRDGGRFQHKATAGYDGLRLSQFQVSSQLAQLGSKISYRLVSTLRSFRECLREYRQNAGGNVSIVSLRQSWRAVGGGGDPVDVGSRTG